MSFENIISGFIGSLIGITISGAFGRLTTAIKLNNYRKLILTYSNFILLKNTEAYVNDYEKAKHYVTNYKEVAFQDLKVDTKYNSMPMLTSDIYKSIPNEYLYKVFLTKPKMYSDFIDIIYSIDFLKRNMPAEKIKCFHQQIRNHLEYEKIPRIEHTAHLSRCTSLLEYISDFIRDADFKIDRAKALEPEMKEIEKYLKGSNIYWTLNYFLRQ